MRASQILTEKSINLKLKNSIFKYKFHFLLFTGFFIVKHHYVYAKYFKRYAYSKKFKKFEESNLIWSQAYRCPLKRALICTLLIFDVPMFHYIIL